MTNMLMMGSATLLDGYFVVSRNWSSLLIDTCVYVVHIAMGPCAKGHFIHARPTFGPGVLLLLLLLLVSSCMFAEHGPIDLAVVTKIGHF